MVICRAELRRADSQQHRFQLQKRAQKLIRLDNVAFAVVFVRINDPAPALAASIA
jgi:hypothetical protein